MHGCDEDAPSALYVDADGNRIYRCPLSGMDAEFFEFLSAFGDFREGMLPEPGGLNDQPGSFLDAARALRSEIAAIQAERQSDG